MKLKNILVDVISILGKPWVSHPLSSVLIVGAWLSSTHSNVVAFLVCCALLYVCTYLHGLWWGATVALADSSPSTSGDK